jgi:hypothetical protein
MLFGSFFTGRWVSSFERDNSIHLYPSYQFLLVDRRAKIESGQRTTSFSFLLNDKHSAIGRMLSSVPRQYREASFMAGQFGQHACNIPSASY